LSYTNKDLCKIRTITTFLTLGKDKAQWAEIIEQASTFCLNLTEVFNNDGYQVQSIRIVTNPFAEYLNIGSLDTARTDLAYISELLSASNSGDMRMRFAIGEAKTAAELALLPELIKEFGDLCNVCVNISPDEFGVLDNELIQHSVQAVQKISAITPRGEGNFNFTVNFNCKPLIPYFPASYHSAELGNKFVIGLETPDLLVEVLKNYNSEHNIEHHNLSNGSGNGLSTGSDNGLSHSLASSADSHTNNSHNSQFKGYYQAMNNALQHHVSQISRLVNKASIDMPYQFAGFDSSAAPSKSCASMAEVYQHLGVEYFGASGSVEASSLLTKVFKTLDDVELVGFSGLMLALTEDTGLAQGSINNDFDIRSLLTYSAVCGIGLDTVPIPGDTPADKIAALMRDTGTMAYRLNKPLTVRLFPVPGLSAGEMTAFESDDLCNCAVLAVP